MREAPFRRVAVFAPGLIGGSLLLAMRRRSPEVELSVWARREETVAEVLAQPGLVDLATTDPAAAAAGAGAIVLAMPTGHMATAVESIGELPPVDGRAVLVTDVGSVKGPVVREIGPLVRARGGAFLGSHPMAGSEKKGFAHAEAELFEGAAVILTTEEGLDQGDELARLRRFWEELGGIVTLLGADRHDELVAGISHLPHLVAASLTRSVLGRAPESGRLSGGGFRDTTRVAGGPEDMWADILADNAAAVSEQLGRYLEELVRWKEALDSLDRQALRGFLSEARALRSALPAPPSRDP